MKLTHVIPLALLAGSPVWVPATARPQASQELRAAFDLAKVGPQVGQRVPDFSLQDQNGRSWTLQSVMGSKGAMLVFQRSADW
jgi:hypothetical protein